MAVPRPMYGWGGCKYAIRPCAVCKSDFKPWAPLQKTCGDKCSKALDDANKKKAKERRKLMMK